MGNCFQLDIKFCVFHTVYKSAQNQIDTLIKVIAENMAPSRCNNRSNMGELILFHKIWSTPERSPVQRKTRTAYRVFESSHGYNDT